MRPHFASLFAVLCSLLPLLFCSCGARQTDPARLNAVKNEVQTFARSVAENVTRRGPSAWQDYFENSSSFFMAVDGRVQFADGAAAQAGIPALSRAISKIELQWGRDLRVDPLTQDLAVIASPWHELMTLADGSHMDTSGYFTAVAERRDGRWQFRNAHWSSMQSAAPAK